MPYSKIKEVHFYRSGHSYYPIPERKLHKFAADSLLLFVICGYVLRRGVPRGRGGERKILLLLLLMTLLFSFGGTAAKHVANWATNRAVCQINFFRSTKFVFPLLAVFLAWFLQDITWRRYKTALRPIILLVIAGLTAPTSAKYILKWQGEESAASSQYDIDEVYEWTRKNTDKDALFLVDPSFAEVFRFRSRRSVVVAFKDVSLMRRRGHDKMIQYAELCQETQAAFDEHNITRLIELAKENSANYLVVPAKVEPPSPAPVFKSQNAVVLHISTGAKRRNR
jgi:hypothetical protein